MNSILTKILNRIPRYILGIIVLIIIIIKTIISYTHVFSEVPENTYQGISLKNISNQYISLDSCKYTMEYDSIKVVITLSKNSKNVDFSSVSLNSKENVLNSCIRPSITPNTHTYQMKSSMITGNRIFIDFEPNNHNQPVCGLKINALLKDDKIYATLFTVRTDVGDINLRYRMNIIIQLDRAN